MGKGYRVALVGVQGFLIGCIFTFFVFLQAVDAPGPDGVELRCLDIVDALVGDGRSDAFLALLQSCRNRRDTHTQRLDVGEVGGIARLFHISDVVVRNTLQGGDGACRVVGHLVGLAARAGKENEVTIGIKPAAATLKGELLIVLVEKAEAGVDERRVFFDREISR